MNIFKEGWNNFASLWTAEKYVCFKGRSSRREYWTTIFMTILFAIGVCVVDMIFSLIIHHDVSSFMLFSVVFDIAMFLPLLSLKFRRLHDVGKSGWWITSRYIGFGVMLLLCLSMMVRLGCMGYNMFSFGFGRREMFYMANSSFSIVFAILLGVGVVALEIICLIFTIFKGESGTNKYGEAPLKDEIILLPSSSEIEEDKCECKKEEKKSKKESEDSSKKDK